MSSIKAQNFMSDTNINSSRKTPYNELRVLRTIPGPMRHMLIINNKSYISGVNGCGLYSSGSV
jgi:hypothetical protein